MKINKEEIIKGKNVAFLIGDDDFLVDDALDSVIEIIKNNNYDECRFEINGVKLIANKGTNFKRLRKEFDAAIDMKYK